MQHKTQAVSFVVAFYRPESYVSDIAENKTLVLKTNKNDRSHSQWTFLFTI
jgi:hypothetical protein